MTDDRPHRSYLLFPLLGLFLWGACGGSAPQDDRPATSLRYVGRAACAECHREVAARFAGSDHDRAMAPATDTTVLGDFSGTVFTSQGVETRFFRDGNRFLVRTEGADGRIDTFRVKYTFGVRPLQQYLVAFPDGRVQTLTVAWDVARQRWFSLYPDERIPPGDFLHWTGRGMNWNYMCAACHSTDLQMHFDLTSNTYHTTWSEIDVSCEACHGPGEAHVAWARAWDGDVRDTTSLLGLTVGMKDRLNARWQIESCAPCHSRRRVVDPAFVPGDDYMDHYTLELLDAEPLYFADGQIRDEVFEYGSFLQSKMYANGVRCSDCHDPHTTRVKRPGNALCTRCHVAQTYDTPAHHFHRPDSTGAACVNCHMPERTYMQVDARRDHSFKVPRPDLTVELGVPNACTGCHAGRTAAWARDRVVAWYGPERRDSVGYARIVAAGRRHAASADTALAALARNADVPAIQRASAAALLAPYTTPLADATLARLVRDPEPLVRLAAVRGYETRPDGVLYETLAPLLEDPVRSIRAEAARLLARVAARHFPHTAETDRVSVFWSALAEYRGSQEAVADQPEAHLNLAVLHETLGAPADAERSYLAALRLDSTFAPAHLNLAMLYNGRRMAAQERDAKAEAARLQQVVERHLRAAIRLAPEAVEVHYTLGLLLAEDPGRIEAAVVHLREAARLSPLNARIQYNTGLALQHLGRAREAEDYLLAAYDLEPRTPDYLYALSILYQQQRRWQDALRYTDALLDLVPEAVAVQQQRARILQEIARE